MAKVRRSSGKKERHSASRQATARVASLFYRQHFAMSPRYPVMAGRFHFALPFFMGGYMHRRIHFISGLPRSGSTLLSAFLLRRFENDLFWRDPQLNPRGVRIV